MPRLYHFRHDTGTSQQVCVLAALQKKNFPVLNVRWKQLRSLEPQDHATDPYVVAVLIALAQAQRERTKQQHLSEPDATGAANNLMWKWDTSTRPGITQPRTQASSSSDTDVENKTHSFKVCVVSIWTAQYLLYLKGAGSGSSRKSGRNALCV